MPDRINEHVWGETGYCQWCGVGSTDNANAPKSCVWRDAPPRGVPQSVFADLTSIGDRLMEIRRAEGRHNEATAEYF